MHLLKDDTIKNIDWDKYIEETPYNDVINGMRLARLTIPSMFSKCGNYYYIRSHDLDCRIDNYNFIESMIDEIESEFKSTFDSLKSECSFDKIERLYLLQVDYIMLSSLSSKNPEDETYFHPEALCDEINSSR